MGGKNIMVWTVNKPAHMMEVCRVSSRIAKLSLMASCIHRLWDGVSALLSLMSRGHGWIFDWLCTVRVPVLFYLLCGCSSATHLLNVSSFLVLNFSSLWINRWLREVCIQVWEAFLVGPPVLFAYFDVPVASAAACYRTCCWTVWWISGFEIYCWIESRAMIISFKVYGYF